MRFFLLLATAALLSAPVLAADSAPRIVSVSAQGKAEATPDRAILPITLETRDRALAVAKQKNDKLADKMLKTIESLAIPKDKLKTTGIFINPQYNWQNNKQNFEGYVVSRSLQVRIDELEKLEKLIAALTEAGVDQVQGVQFDIADPAGLESAARKDAMDKARAKATELATAAGAKLGRVVSINDNGGGGYVPPMPMPRAMMAQAKAEDAAAPPPLPGTMSIEQNVLVVYELE